MCGRALNARNEELRLSDLALKARTEESAAMALQIEDLEDSANAWYNNRWFWLGVGLVGGAVIVK